jgi:translation initiation factor 1A
MPKNLKAKKNGTARTNEPRKFEMVYKEDVVGGGAVYGQVVKVLGDCNFTVRCFMEKEMDDENGIGHEKELLCHLRKSAKKKGRVEVNSIVLVGLRDFQEGKGDILHTYHVDQAKLLVREGRLPNTKTANNFGETNEEEEDIGIDFDDI